jgi:adenylate cyclase
MNGPPDPTLAADTTTQPTPRRRVRPRVGPRWSIWRRRLDRPWPRALGLALVVWALLAWVTTTRGWYDIELNGFDALSVATAPMQSGLPIVLVGIDDASMAELRQRWPWPRELHARLIDALTAAGAAVVAFDVLFEFQTERDDDQALRGAIERAGNVVLGAGMVQQNTPYGTIWQRKEPLPLFVAHGGAQVGLVNLEFDRDQAMRRIPDGQDVFWRTIVARLQAQMPDQPLNTQVPPGSLIRYTGPPGTYPRVPFYMALEPDKYLKPGDLADALVIVGRDTRSASDVGAAQVDTFPTPFSLIGHGHMPGMEVHANILENVLGGAPVRPAPRWQQQAALALAVLLASALMVRFRPFVSAIAGVGLIGAAGGAAYALFVQQLVWLPVIIAMVGVVLVYVGHALLAFAAEREQRMVVKRIFSRYVPEAVVNQLAAHPESVALGGQRRVLTLLFTDLAGFTGLSEKLDPERAADLLNRYLTAMNEVIFRHGGTIDKFIGDAVMAFWNAPLADEAHARRALQAAIEMQQAMAQLNAGLAAEGLPPLGMRVGLHTGDALVGNMGSNIGRLSYTAIGDTVNLASRLEGANKAYGTAILFSAATLQAAQTQGWAGAPDLPPVRPVDRVQVKGRAEAVDVFSPCASADEAAAVAAAMQAFRQRDWASASAQWQALHAARPGDDLPRVYLDRLATIAAQPLPDDWDGSWALDSK